jgi:hypothetical protein
MTKTTGRMRKICGNCRYHNAYVYPDTVFCFARFAKKQESAVSILFGCDEWEEQQQDCFCLEDHMKKQKKTAK